MLTLLLALTSFATAVLSGIFGMAGGMLLMGVYASVLPIATAMVLHGGTQLIANSARAVILWRNIYVRGFLFYVTGALTAFAVMSQLRYLPPLHIVFLGLGLAPFVAMILPARLLDFERPAAAFIVGIQVVAVQLIAGAAGPLLDVAFVRTKLNRNQVVATKAVTQVFSHLLKLAYFATFMSGRELTPMRLLAILAATLLGTYAGTRILARMSERSFFTWSRYIIYAIGVLYLYKAFAAWK